MTASPQKRSLCQNLPGWWLALPHALVVSALILGLFYYWYAVADRYSIFLYNHFGAPPFQGGTISRYWMCGLVASGAIMVLYTVALWYLGRLAGLRYCTYQPPAWSRVWAMATVPLVPGILFITMTLNRPTLPLGIAVTCVAVTLAGLSLALPSGALAARRPSELAWLALEGVGLVPELLLLRVIELPGLGVTSWSTAYVASFCAVLGGAAWTLTAARLHFRRHRALWHWWEPLASGFALSYLLLPLVHYLFLTPPGFRYISVAANFFAQNLSIQASSFLAAATLAVVATRFGQR